MFPNQPVGRKIANIKTSDSIKILGIHIDNLLTFQVHINHISSNLHKKFFILKRYLTKYWKFNSRKKVILYKSMILPAVLYASEVWSSRISNSLLRKLEQAHRKFLILTSNAYPSISYQQAYLLTNVPSTKIIMQKRLEYYLFKQTNTDPTLTRLFKQTIVDNIRNHFQQLSLGNVEIFRASDGSINPYLHRYSNFTFSQLLTGHGCFRKHLVYLRKIRDHYCNLCNLPMIQDYKHVLSECPA
ncbi:unnamed protein product, partial [Ectocarpus sp. 12 AP-2014]